MYMTMYGKRYEAVMKLYADGFPIHEQRQSEVQAKILQDTTDINLNLSMRNHFIYTQPLVL